MANLGGSYSMYTEEDKTQTDMSTNQDYTNTFFKSNLIIGLGLDISF
jgi:hypothetical protein